ncbi:c-type cytochrome [Massilia endophytica]|uniref:c-type cytochrome n=1 Tax=Massilia endophytica TaxID=2899220 RepID=UPI001E4C1F4F|nr:c-type cytochrome [Massilia endophytica]UGQ48675.1 c-type cytochrome [Massilia endophytica]
MASNRIRLAIKTVVATLAVLGVAALSLGLAVLYGGWYNVGATRQHFQFVHTLLEKGMHESVRHHARGITPPPFDARMARHGAAIYAAHCVKCHGAPGVAQEDFGQSMQPVPGPLVDAARHWKEREMYWITRHGIKMSGMPAWEFHLSEEELWSVVAFLRELPALTPQAYRAATEGAALPVLAPRSYPVDVERGRTALAQHACQACHLIPGVTGPDAYVGPPLKDMAERKFIAGSLPNSADNLARWIRAPHEVDPATAMPQLGVSERDARDMAAYLLQAR